MKTRTLLLKMILAAAALILAGCQNPLEPPKTADTSSRSAPVGFGSVTIDLGSAVRQAGRTVYPGHAGLVYGYTFTKTGGEPQTLEPQGGSFTLEYGEWTVEVRAWLGAKTDANLAASGAATFTVNAATQTVAVELAGVTEAGTGTFKYRIQYPDGATVTSFTLVKFPELTDSVVLGAPATATAGGVTTITGTKSNVPAGYYFVTVMLERNGKAAGKNEVVHIYNKLASEYGTEAEPVVFVDTDFSAMTTLAENIWADGNLVSGDDENWYKFTATAAYLNASAQFSGTLLETEGVDVVVYDSDGIVAGGRTQLYKNSLSVYHAVTPGAVYYIKVTSFNPTRTGTYRIKGAGMAADTIPPAPVHNLTANMASGSVTLYWSNPDDADFDYTEITFTPPAAGGIASYTVPKPGASKTITGLTNNQQYSFTIKAVDTNGNRSAPGSISLTPRASASITRYHPVPAPGAPVVVKAYTYLGKKYVLAYLGEIQNVPVLYDPPLYNDGVNAAHHRIEETQSTAFTEERSIETTKAKTVTDSLVTDYGVEGRVTGTLGAGPAKLEGEIKAHWNQTNSQTVVTEEKIRNTYGTVFTTFFSRTEERNYEIPITSPVGWYRYTLFSTQDVYATLVFNGSNLDRVEYVILTRPSRAYKFDYATDAEGYDFGRNSTAPKLILTSPNITFLRGCPAEALANDTNRTVHGGQREYRYRAVTDGQITVKLVGGGAGGTGAAAARDTSGGTNTSAAAGKAGNGGPTILYLDNQNRLTVAGGTGQNGPASGLRGGWFLGIGHNSDWNLESGNVFVSNGYKGEDGKEDTITLTVSQNQVIRITVGWGGGGSGGCAINVVGGQISSEGASNSCFSIEKFDRRNGYTDAIASRGGLGAMHSLLCPNPAHNFPDDLVHGGVSLAAGNATAAPGGQKMGEGGEGGDELATGGVFASGGGGGAAGGFIFSNSTAIIEEIPPEEW